MLLVAGAESSALTLAELSPSQSEAARRELDTSRRFGKHVTNIFDERERHSAALCFAILG